MLCCTGHVLMSSCMYLCMLSFWVGPCVVGQLVNNTVLALSVICVWRVWHMYKRVEVKMDCIAFYSRQLAVNSLLKCIHLTYSHSANGAFPFHPTFGPICIQRTGAVYSSGFCSAATHSLHCLVLPRCRVKWNQLLFIYCCTLNTFSLRFEYSQ